MEKENITTDETPVEDFLHDGLDVLNEEIEQIDALFDEPEIIKFKGEEKQSDDIIKILTKYKQTQIKCGTEIGHYLSLSVDQLLHLYHKKSGSKRSKKHILEAAYLNFIFMSAKYLKEWYSTKSAMFADALQNCSKAFVKAAKNYKPEHGSTFKHYHLGYFRSAITETFKNTSVVSHKSNDSTQYSEVEFSEESEADTAVDSVAEGIVYSKELIAWLRVILNDENLLTPDEKDVIVSYYGLDNNDPVGFKEIAKNREAADKGSSYSRISQLHTGALAKIREYIEKNGIELRQ